MQFSYRPRGVCSQQMDFDIENDVIQSVKIYGGCSGNLQGISRLVEGKNVDEVIGLLRGIRCGMKPTSCPDQLARALELYKEG